MNRAILSALVISLSLPIYSMEEQLGEPPKKMGKVLLGATIVGGFLLTMLFKGGSNRKISDQKKLAAIEKKLNALDQRLDKITELLEKNQSTNRKKRRDEEPEYNDSASSEESSGEEEPEVVHKQSRRERPRSTHLQQVDSDTVSSSKKKRHQSDRVLRPSRTESVPRAHHPEPSSDSDDEELVPVSRRSEARRSLERSYSADAPNPPHGRRDHERPKRLAPSRSSSPRGAIASIDELRESTSGDSSNGDSSNI